MSLRSDRHRLSKGCDLPSARRRWHTSLWICPECGQGWVTTREQPDNIAPTALSWWWKRWPFTGEGSQP